MKKNITSIDPFSNVSHDKLQFDKVTTLSVSLHDESCWLNTAKTDSAAGFLSPGDKGATKYLKLRKRKETKQQKKNFKSIPKEPDNSIE